MAGVYNIHIHICVYTYTYLHIHICTYVYVSKLYWRHGRGFLSVKTVDSCPAFFYHGTGIASLCS